MLQRVDLLRTRIASQLLSGDESSGDEPSGRGAEGIAEAARHMLALQGQDPVAARWALGRRVPGSTIADVLAAQETGAVVRSWPMRGTVHLVPAEDIGWMQRLLTPRMIGDAPKRREQLGLPLETLDRMRDIAVDRLRGGGRISRADLLAAFVEDGIEMRTGWSYHSVWWLCQTGPLVFGPPLGSREAALVLAEEWIREPAEFEGETALIELGARYLIGHGPATPADLAWWTRLSLGQARRAFAEAEAVGRAERLEVDGAVWWTAPGAAEAPVPEIPDVLLLPAFDELLLGYRDRSLSADERHIRSLMSSNGIAVPTVMVDGRAVGMWRMKDDEVTVTAFDGARLPSKRRLAPEMERVRAFSAA